MSARLPLPVDTTDRSIDYACALHIHRRIRRARRSGSIVTWGCVVALACFACLVMLGWLPS